VILGTFHPDALTESSKVDPATGLAKTGQIVEKLVHQLDYKTFEYNTFMDNYFTSINLFQRFRNIGIGAAGTAKKECCSDTSKPAAGKQSTLEYSCSI
jgi:hypothetical protein